MESGKLAADTVLQNRYRILSLLKHGGMGSVYLAEDLRFRSRVAVKEAYFTQGRFRQAFAHEAGLLHRLRHRVLPHVTDHLTEGEAQYLVMQLFPGKDLEELLTDKIRETGEAFECQRMPANAGECRRMIDDHRSYRYISIDTPVWRRAEAIELPGFLHHMPG